MRKAQTVIELLTTYSWTILIILIFLAILYYYKVFEPFKIVPEQCNFGPAVSCTTFKFQQKNATDSAMRLLLIFSNGLGRDIAFESNMAIITTEGVGKVGTWNYTGTCNPIRFVIKGGDQFVCTFDITDTDAVPSFGNNVKFKSQIGYLDCGTDVHYTSTGGCARGSRRKAYGDVVTAYMPYTYVEYCGNGFCNATAGENESTCGMDCQMGRPIPFINVTSPVNFVAPPTGYYHKVNVPLNFTFSPPDIRLAYSLDEGRDVSLQGNTSIPGRLSTGMHNVTVYADWNSSQAIIFRYCLGDIKEDYLIDMSDLGRIGVKFECQCGQACWDAIAYSADLNDDCIVNQTDLDILQSVYGQSC